MKVADAVADNPGTWLFHCHVADHMREGMFASFTVHARDTVGVGRGPAEAFLGTQAGTQSLRLDRVETVVQRNAQPQRSELIIEGAVTVFDGFAVHNEPIQVQIGGRTLEFNPQKNGIATAPEAQFRIKNANEFGVVRGGVMEFELVLQGADWINERDRTAAMVTLTLDVARSHHVGQRVLVAK